MKGSRPVRFDPYTNTKKKLLKRRKYQRFNFAMFSLWGIFSFLHNYFKWLYKNLMCELWKHIPLKIILIVHNSCDGYVDSKDVRNRYEDKHVKNYILTSIVFFHTESREAYIHVYIHTYLNNTHIYIYVQTHTRTYIQACIHTYRRTYRQAHIHRYIDIDTYTYICSYIHTYIHTNSQIHILYLHTSIQIYIPILRYTYIYIYIPSFIQT